MILVFSATILTTAFLLMKHPLSMGLILLAQTILISLITGNLAPTFWYSYILFLIMVGGMLILFMYMTSIASNEKFKSSMKFLIIILSPIILMLISKYSLNLFTKTNDSIAFIYTTDMSTSMNKFIQNNSYQLILFLMIYLLITLIATVKISYSNQGPLRQMFN
uniref:NADH dehydrogenase subunit 6 n=1 Tax=Exostira schroederi TaxID=2969970 RepID=UPI002176A821|nr:NADH dehydrogenase subunit 6 [Exostira schroederi]UUL71675.1 NADH dehydrogenase subunit 6 [Exostira schroederi]